MYGKSDLSAFAVRLHPLDLNRGRGRLPCEDWRMDTPWRTWGTTNPPEKITQEAWDRDDGHLRRLVRLRPGQRAEAADLWAYTQDLLYTEIQGPLLAYLFPFCLNAWREDFRGISAEYGGAIEWFYLVLANRQVFDVYLTSDQGAAVSQFMRQTILEEIDDQRGLSFRGKDTRAYGWFGALTTYGVLLPDLESLWNPWWSVDTVGRAIAAIQYVSCLMYPENDNPVFAPWTRDEGGGPPCLWDFEGHLYTHRWLQPNVDFLKNVLTVPTVSDLLTRAVERLTNQPEHNMAARIHDDLPLCIETLRARCDELPPLLEATQEPGSVVDFKWSK